MRWWTYALIGLGAGLLAGLFGVGGGTIIVPALVSLAAMDRRLSAGTSLAAILPLAGVGVVSYGVHGNVSLVAAAILTVGTVAGVQIGSWLLTRLSQQALRWAFAAFIAVMVVQLVLAVPSREGALEVTLPAALALVGVGLATGTLAGLLGVGGGVLVVPALIILFGVSDLLAKGTSLLMMIPTALAGTVANLRRGNVDLRAALLVGGSACLSVVAGERLATLLPPREAVWLFAVFLLYLLVRTVRDALRHRRRT